MQRRKSKRVLIYFFLLFLVASINNNSINQFNFKFDQKIKVSGLDEKDNRILLNEIKNLNLDNIFLINGSEIRKIIDTNPLIEKYQIFKEYPDTINVKVKKANFFAKINNNGEIFLIGSNGKLLQENFYKDNLPFIFGKPNIEEFLNFKKSIDRSNLSYEEIENIFFFPSKRWDIKLKNNVLLKLPKNLNQEFLDNIHIFLQSNNFEKFKIIDYRITNQIIIDE